MHVFPLLFPARIEDSSSCREDTVQLLQVAEKHQSQERPQPCPSRCGCSDHQVPQVDVQRRGTSRERLVAESLVICKLSWDSHYPFHFLVICDSKSCDLWAPCWLISCRGHVSKIVDMAKLFFLINYVYWQTSFFSYNNKDFAFKVVFFALRNTFSNPWLKTSITLSWWTFWTFYFYLVSPFQFIRHNYLGP